MTAIYTGTLAALVTSMTATAATPEIERLLDAIEIVESGGNPSIHGDGGRSHGAYQIQWAYWHDARMPGLFEDVHDKAYARATILRYWQRVAPHALASGDLQWLARTHNGGPRGAIRSSTVRYWARVRKVMRNGVSHD